jgi:hypothetical protein
MALPLHDVGSIDASRHDADQHFPRSRHRIRPLNRPEYLGRARGRDLYADQLPTSNQLPSRNALIPFIWELGAESWAFAATTATWAMQ